MIDINARQVREVFGFSIAVPTCDFLLAVTFYSISSTDVGQWVVLDRTGPDQIKVWYWTAPVHFRPDRSFSILLLLVCVSFTIIGQPRNSVLISVLNGVISNDRVCIVRDPAWSVSHCTQSWTTVTGYSACCLWCPIPAVNKNLAAKCDKLPVTTVQQLLIAKPDIRWESRF